MRYRNYSREAPATVASFWRREGEPCYAARLIRTIAIVGPGRLARTLVPALRAGGYTISEIIARQTARPMRSPKTLARPVRTRVHTANSAPLKADLVWFCVPDSQIAAAARELSGGSWKGKVAFHSSGALPSDELDVLRKQGASIGSVHPLMTFVRGSRPSLQQVAFAIEGDAKATETARRIVRTLGGEPFLIRKQAKAAYHAWGTFASPLLLSALVTAEQVARAAGISAGSARKRIFPIALQTLRNYVDLGPAASFSGPIVRGDAATVRSHLKMLRRIPEAREAYLALARSALKHLPVKNRPALRQLLKP